MKKRIISVICVLLSFVLILSSTIISFSKPSRINTLDEKNVKLVFAAWADSQIGDSKPEREPYLYSACNDLGNAECNVDALVLAGDITETASQDEWDNIYDDLSETGARSFILAAGNHDVRRQAYSNAISKFTKTANRLNSQADNELSIKQVNYTYTINGYKFIVVGTNESKDCDASINQSQLNWLDSQLKNAPADKPVFVICHQPLKKTHGAPATWDGNKKNDGSVGAQSDALKNTLNKYKNVILLTGHLHTGMGDYTYQKIGSFISISLPSITIDNKDGVYNKNGIGYMVEVYDNRIVFRARNFDLEEYVPACDIVINLDGSSVKASKPSSVKLSSLKPAYKKITVSWSKNTKAYGYQIQYSTSSKFTKKYTKSIFVNSSSTASKSISKLSSKKRYYVRVRAYSLSNCKKVYSSWSNTKNCRTK